MSRDVGSEWYVVVAFAVVILLCVGSTYFRRSCTRLVLRYSFFKVFEVASIVYSGHSSSLVVNPLLVGDD